jgi:hypothetical protein
MELPFNKEILSEFYTLFSEHSPYLSSLYENSPELVTYLSEVFDVSLDTKSYVTLMTVLPQIKSFISACIEGNTMNDETKAVYLRVWEEYNFTKKENVDFALSGIKGYDSSLEDKEKEFQKRKLYAEKEKELRTLQRSFRKKTYSYSTDDYESKRQEIENEYIANLESRGLLDDEENDSNSNNREGDNLNSNDTSRDEYNSNWLPGGEKRLKVPIAEEELAYQQRNLGYIRSNNLLDDFKYHLYYDYVDRLSKNSIIPSKEEMIKLDEIAIFLNLQQDNKDFIHLVGFGDSLQRAILQCMSINGTISPILFDSLYRLSQHYRMNSLHSSMVYSVTLRKKIFPILDEMYTQYMKFKKGLGWKKPIESTTEKTYLELMDTIGESQENMKYKPETEDDYFRGTKEEEYVTLFFTKADTKKEALRKQFMISANSILSIIHSNNQYQPFNPLFIDSFPLTYYNFTTYPVEVYDMYMFYLVSKVVMEDETLKSSLDVYPDSQFGSLLGLFPPKMGDIRMLTLIGIYSEIVLNIFKNKPFATVNDLEEFNFLCLEFNITGTMETNGMNMKRELYKMCIKKGYEKFNTFIEKNRKETEIDLSYDEAFVTRLRKQVSYLVLISYVLFVILFLSVLPSFVCSFFFSFFSLGFFLFFFLFFSFSFFSAFVLRFSRRFVLLLICLYYLYCRLKVLEYLIENSLKIFQHLFFFYLFV